MKKIFLTVAVLVAAFNVASATDVNRNEQLTAASASEQRVLTEHDPYREHELQQSQIDQHIIRFYDIDRIVIKNDHQALIRIYNDKWQLLEQTDQDVDKTVAEGNYFVTSTSRITGRYKH